MDLKMWKRLQWMAGSCVKKVLMVPVKGLQILARVGPKKTNEKSKFAIQILFCKS